MKYIPHKYQLRMMHHINLYDHCAVWAEAGLGKTVTTATVGDDLLREQVVKKILIVGPKRVVQHVWPNEFAKWDHLQHLSFMSLSCPLAQRIKLLKDPSPIHLINYELLPWLVERHSRRSWPYDMVIWDESSKLKNRATKRFKAARTISRAVTRSIQLSATPSPNGLMDLWSQIFLLDQGERLGKSLTSYRSRWFNENPYIHTYTPRFGASEEIHERIRDICCSLSAADYLDMPARIDNNVIVSLPEDVRTMYTQAQKDLLLEIDGQVITATNAAVLTNKLLQVCNGAVYDEDGLWTPVHSEKITALQDIIEEAEGPVLVATSYRADEERLLQAIPQAVALAKAPGAIDEWNAGRIPVGLAHPASMGHGLNLQDGGHTLVWFGMTWSLELYQQMCARLHRQGQTRPVIVHHILAEDTIDGYVRDVLAGKASVQDALMGAVKI